MAGQVDLLSLSAKLDLQTAAFQKGIDQANRALDRMGKNFDKTNKTIQRTSALLKGVAQGMLAAFSARAVMAAIRNTADYGDQLAKLSSRLEVSAQFLSELNYAAESSGIPFNTATTAIQRMDRRLAELAMTGKGVAKDALDILGLSISQFANKDAEQKFHLIAEAMGRVDDNSRKLLASMKLFDTEGVALLQMISDGSGAFDAMAENARRLGATLDDVQSQNLETLTQSFTDLSRTVGGIVDRMIADWAPRITWMIDVVRDGVVRLEGAIIMLANAAQMASTSGIMSMIKGDFTDLAELYQGLDKFRNGAPELLPVPPPTGSGSYSGGMGSGSAGRRGGGNSAARQAERDAEMIANAFQRVRESLEPLYALENRHQDAVIAVMQAYDNGLVSLERHDAMIAQLEQRFEASKLEIKLGDLGKAMQDFAHGFSDTLVDSILQGKMAFEDFVRSFVAGIAKMQLQKAFSGILGGFGGGFTNLFQFASGGVVGSPTLFPMASGVGLMGEAGPEMIAPIRRGKDGAMGVGASPTIINISNNTPAQITAEERTGLNGEKEIRLLIEETVKTGFSEGRFDRVMSGNYGARRRPF